MNAMPQAGATRRPLDFGDLPPQEWFTNPNLPMLTPLTITREGRTFGHLAGWGVAHRGLSGRVTPPRSRTNYARYVNKTAVVAGANGEPHVIPAANLTMGIGHAPMHLGLAAAAEHYDNATSIIAQIAVFEDEHGICYSGAVLPDVAPAQLRRALSCAISGDWRRQDSTNSLELCAALLVPCEGFEQPAPRARVASGAPMALVAAGLIPPRARSFARRVDPSWRPTAAAAGKPLDINALADVLADKLDARRTAGELSSAHADLVARLDDTPAVVAALLAEVDDSPVRMAELFAEFDGRHGHGSFGVLDEKPGSNWIQELPAALRAAWDKSIVYRAATHMHQERGMEVGHAIASALNWARDVCTTGDVANWKGPQSVNPKSRAECCEAIALWQTMRTAAKADN